MLLPSQNEVFAEALSKSNRDYGLEDYPVLTLTFDDRTRLDISGFEDISTAMRYFVTARIEGGVGRWLDAKVSLPYAGIDFEVQVAVSRFGAWTDVLFADGSKNVYYEPKELGSGTWDQACTDGIVQAKLEALVRLVDLSDLAALLEQDDRIHVDGIRTLLTTVAKTRQPQREIVLPALKWLGLKVDRFVNATVDSAGKVVGKAIVGATALTVARYFPALAQTIDELLRLAN
jgi:hypothetical protein